MVAYVGVTPLAEAVLAGRSRRRTMVWLDATRMVLLVPFAFATSGWQIAVLALLFFAVSSGFTPMFQSVIPDILPDEASYGRALALSRVAYTLESILSPVIAAGVLRLISGEQLFLVAAASFVGSILALLATRFPPDTGDRRKGPFLARAMKGLWIYRQTPRLRGVILMNFALSIAMAWVLVNTAVFAAAKLGDAERFYPMLMAGYGVGAAAGALLVPRMLRRLDERQVMLAGAVLHAVLGLGILIAAGFAGYLVLWAQFVEDASLEETRGGQEIARSARPVDRPAAFAAQFSLSHSGWLVAYPLAGWLAARIGLEPALLVLSALCLAVAGLAARVWPAHDPLERAHDHPELPADHPHLREAGHAGGGHRHHYFIDELHPHWASGRPA
ncbi:MAG: MFS transporter [Paracoccaceae bacterium]